MNLLTLFKELKLSPGGAVVYSMSTGLPPLNQLTPLVGTQRSWSNVETNVEFCTLLKQFINEYIFLVDDPRLYICASYYDDTNCIKIELKLESLV